MTLGVDIATGLASSLIFEGLKRPYKALTDAKSRKRSIAAALQDKAPYSGEMSQALEDLATVIGHETGEYTTNVRDFFRELEKSGIPDALRHIVLCDKDPDIAFQAFDNIYSSFENLPFKSQCLFNALIAGIKARIAAAVSDPVILESIQIYSKDISRQIDIIQSAVNDIGSRKPRISIQRIVELRTKLAKAIENSNRSINVETTQGTKKVAINRLVIPARLRPVDEAKILEDQKPTSDNTLSFLVFRRSFHRVVILGDPGGGKSTITQNLCYSHAHQMSLEQSNPAHSSFDTRDLRIPLKIILRSLDRRQQSNPSYGIIDYLATEIRQLIDIDEDESIEFLRYILGYGQAILLFDGLDEILNVEPRAEMVKQIEAFCDNYALCPAIVTSRIVGYRDAPLSLEYQLYTLARFNVDEVRKFSEKLIAAVSGEKPKVAKSLAASFVAQTEVSAADLRHNPLLLGLMVYIYVIRGDVPNNRPEIYKECSLLMFEKWDQRRDIIFKVPTDFDLLDLFGYLASEIFGEAETEDGVSDEWLRGRLRSFFDDWYDDRSRAVSAARSLLDFITGRAWVMCEIGPKVFKFTHRTFLEYFFARRLEEVAGGVSSLLSSQLYDKIINREWDVVAHLALQISTFRSGPKSVQAADELDRLFLHPRNSKEETNFLTFVALSLAYLNLPEARIRSFVRELVRRSIALGATSDAHAAEIIEIAIRSTVKRSDVGISETVALMTPVLQAGSSAERNFCLYAIRSIQGHDATVAEGRSSAGRPDLWRIKADKLITDIEGEQLKRASVDIQDARFYLWLYRKHWVVLFKKYGIQLFSINFNALLPPDMPLLIHSAIFDVLYTNRTRRRMVSSSDVSGALEIIVGMAGMVVDQKDVSKLRVDFPEPFRQIASSYLDDALHDIIFGVGNPRADAVKVGACLIVVLFLFTMQGDTPASAKSSRRVGAARYPMGLFPPGIIERFMDRLEPGLSRLGLDSWIAHLRSLTAEAIAESGTSRVDRRGKPLEPPTQA
jgi:hypothetical protein